MVEVRVRAVGIDSETDRPVVLLQETEERERMLVVAIGEPEAVALASVLEGTRPRGRPGTHQLIGDILAAFGRQLRSVRVRGLSEQIFLAELQLDDGTVVDARTSDAVVLALQADVRIDVADTVIDRAGVAPRTITMDQAGPGPGPPEVEEFRRFLDDAVPDDFGEDPP
ncbi:bifunctional nuclease family protein [Pseudonocardia parietis]|uniref:Bifunctional DNase/RNase n=1 Tax=Pseudonocardia parietis TaxID=570936 RepID=A0ABS4VVA9_9PSEU|nr:bifunctional nuclease family protein [Pseudonocardia parietis]MBP2367872.1 bifunctional DNase/RNase [Pseudonocardia parietis]